MMKRLRSKKMKLLLERGKRLAKRRPNRRPSDGMMTGLINENGLRGWHYQVEWIHDTRFEPKPWIVAYAFSPSSHGIATHFLR
jgi:hypothetical protein